MLDWRKQNILFIGDAHIPYMHPDYLNFLVGVAHTFNVDKVANVGDLLDLHGFSRHPKHPSLDSSGQEVLRATEEFMSWLAAFPKMEIILGNHERRFGYKLREAGFPDEIVSTEKMLRMCGLPESWGLHDRLLLDTDGGPTTVIHGDEAGLSIIPGKALDSYHTNVVQGHVHSRAYTYYVSTPGRLVWHMNVGCGVDRKGYAMAYAGKNLKRQIRSCGVLIGGVPIVIPMTLKSNGRWNGKVLGG